MPATRKPQSTSPTSAPRQPCGQAEPVYSLSMAWMATIAPSDAGFSDAIESAVLPPYEMPQIPVRPVHHGWAAIQARASKPSIFSAGANGGCGTPSDSP